MKVLLVGANHEQAIENHFLKHLKKVAEVKLVNTHGQYLDYYHGNTLHKILTRLKLSKIISKLNRELLQEVEAFKPDVLLVFKGMEINASTLAKIKSKGIKLTNYNPDHPTKHYYRGSGNKNVLINIPIYDHHFCYSKEIQEELESRFNVQTSWLPFAFVHSQKNESTALIRRICFIGNPDNIRADLLNKLLSNHVPIQLFGFKWENFIDEKYIKEELCSILESTFNVEKAQKFCVQLNVFRPHNIGSHNLRTFEMPAIGTIMLAPYSKEHEMLFKEGEEAFFYKNFDDLLEKCNYLLNLSEEEVRKVQLNAYNRSIQSNYGYQGRVDHIIEVFQELLSNKTERNTVS